MTDGTILAEEEIEQINFEYARDYSIVKDLEIIFSNISKLGRNN